ncbi:S8 family serine peptidase [Tessaracoccus sp. G1721]
MSEDHPWPVSDVAELEAGVDVAAQMLQRYNPALDTWDLPKTGEFWDAVADAHRDTHTGRDTTVAVIDGGFDTTIPALSSFPVDGDDPGRTAHGSVVALLVRQVAPEAQLRLFTVTRDGAVDPDLVASAIRRATADGAHVINLSLGWKVELPEEVLRDVSPSQVVGWRRHLRLPSHPVSDAVAEARAQGVTVVAACGNKATSVLIPAVTDDAGLRWLSPPRREAPAAVSKPLAPGAATRPAPTPATAPRRSPRHTHRSALPRPSQLPPRVGRGPRPRRRPARCGCSTGGR